MLIDRNTTGMFQYNIYPVIGICRNFIKELFESYYLWNLKECDLLLTEYIVCKKYMEYIHDEKMNDELNNDFIEIRNYFLNRYGMVLENYVGDFVGCSHGCSFVKKFINNLIKEGE